MSVEVLYNQKALENRINELAAQITEDYNGEEVVILGVLKGCFLFCADCVRKINLPLIVDFISLSSYGDGTVSSGNVKINLDISADITNKNVLVIEDIIDTGNTFIFLNEYLKKKNPKSIKIASLFSKPSKHIQKFDIDYIGFEIEDHFIVGYGMDLAGKYRALPYVGIYTGE